MSTLAHSPHHKTALWFVEKGQERNGKGEKKVTALSPLGVCFRGGFKLASKLLGGEEGGTRDYSLKYPVKNHSLGAFCKFLPDKPYPNRPEAVLESIHQFVK